MVGDRANLSAISIEYQLIESVSHLITHTDQQTSYVFCDFRLNPIR